MTSLEFDSSILHHQYITPIIVARYWEEKYWTLSALVFISLEYIFTFPYEFVYIWRYPITNVKTMYLFSRYFGLLYQISNNLILAKIHTRLPATFSTCLDWYIFQNISFLLLFSAMEIILMLRVYALYNQSMIIGWCLTSLFIFEVALTSTLASRNVPALQFDIICNAIIAPYESFIFAVGMMLVQLIVAVLTVAGRRTGRTDVDVRIVKLVLRDGFWAFTIVSAVMSIIVPYSFAKQLARPFVVYAWPNCLFSFTTCRLIMNLQQFKFTVPDHHIPQQAIPRTPSEVELPPMLVSSHAELEDLNIF
ncbi:hypothetical protein BDQ17DRAFT_1384751 [Cyathus striatus]|nr:hypothetical protein BDQ17DRAFT_1384751 [Cyathus striatus]